MRGMAYEDPNPVTVYLAAVGNNIRYYRQKKGLTLEALGEDIGLDKGNMHRIEKGKNITLETLCKISALLEVEMSVLVTTTVNMTYEAAEKYITAKKHQRLNTKKEGDPENPAE